MMKIYPQAPVVFQKIQPEDLNIAGSRAGAFQKASNAALYYNPTPVPVENTSFQALVGFYPNKKQDNYSRWQIVWNKSPNDHSLEQLLQNPPTDLFMLTQFIKK